MAKECSNCGFADNPNDAHYCGKCGELLLSNEIGINLLSYHLASKNRQAQIRKQHEYVLITRNELSSYQADRDELDRYHKSFWYKAEHLWSRIIKNKWFKGLTWLFAWLFSVGLTYLLLCIFYNTNYLNSILFKIAIGWAYLFIPSSPFVFKKESKWYMGLVYTSIWIITIGLSYWVLCVLYNTNHLNSILFNSIITGWACLFMLSSPFVFSKKSKLFKGVVWFFVWAIASFLLLGLIYHVLCIFYNTNSLNSIFSEIIGIWGGVSIVIIMIIYYVIESE